MVTSRLIAGVMSGTSADGIDVALCKVEMGGEWGELVGYKGTAYSREVREEIHAIRRAGAGDRGGHLSLGGLGELTRKLTLEHAAAVNQTLAAFNIPRADAVADHGQTLFHAPPVTMQVLDPALLAAEVGAQVISDFRRADCAAGGQGAPLVPYADFILFQTSERTRALLNLGGIANVTLLPAGRGLDSLIAFDTGPANCLSDHLCRVMTPSGPGYDVGGRLAAAGRVNNEIVARFLRSRYFQRTPPKSTDGPEMIAAFEGAGGMTLELKDALATAAACVGSSVADALLRMSPVPDEVVVSGGGVNHPLIMAELKKHLGGIAMRTTDELGIPGAAKEAIAFALLGAATLDGRPANVPSCTGAKRAVVLGAITPRP